VSRAGRESLTCGCSKESGEPQRNRTDGEADAFPTIELLPRRTQNAVTKPYDLRARSFVFACEVVGFCIALKESREARIWLRVIRASEPSLKNRADPLIAEASEFVAILIATIEFSFSLVPYCLCLMSYA
jgi:hypothetical protein